MNLKKNYRYLLVISIFLIALGMTLTLLFDNEKDLLDAPIYKFIFGMPLGIVFFYVVIFAPLTEEIAFRSWACKKKAWTWVSFAVSSLFVFLINAYAGIIYSGAFLSIILFLKNKPKLRLFSFLILTSVSFAALHYGNLQPRSFFLSFPQYIGMGLLFSYIALRFNLLTSIIVHALNNFIAIAAMGMIFTSSETKTLENSTYRATLTRVPPQWGSGSNSTAVYKQDTIKINNYTIGSIIEGLTENSDTLFWVMDNKAIDFKKYNLKVEQKDTNTKIDYREVLIDLAKLKEIKIDTVKEKHSVWVLNAKNWDTISYKHLEDYDTKTLTLININMLCSDLSTTSLIPDKDILNVVPQKGVNDNVIIIDDKFYKKNTFAEKKEFLETRHGITLTKKDTLINIIQIRNK